MLPFNLRMGEKTSIRGGYIGSVSVHLQSRGQGHMKHLMQMLLDRAENEKYDFLCLGGQRQRYGYWDFDKGGVELNYRVNSANVRHTLQNVDDSSIRLIPIENLDAGEMEQLAEFCCFVPLTCEREHTLLSDIMSTWKA